MRVALLTSAALPGLWPDDRHLLPALAAQGINGVPCVWEDPLEDWRGYAGAVVRSAWDYAFRYEAFLHRLDEIDARTRVSNPVAVVRWSTHKRYLTELARDGIPTVPTTVYEHGHAPPLTQVWNTAGRDALVVKPAVGNSGRYLRAVSATNLHELAPWWAEVTAAEDMLIQPRLDCIASHGETSLIWVGGEVTHAVLKRAPADSLLVHDIHGGTVERIVPDHDSVALAERVMAAYGAECLYGRIDLVRADDGAWQIMEVELAEPELHFALAPEAATQFATVLRARLDGG